MKTLDEVIKALELCTEDYDCVGNECPYRQEGTCCDLVAVPKMQADALHYLKHLQDYYEISANGGLLTPEPRSGEIGSDVEIKWHEPNPPLTWDELRNMEGKPVWLEYGISFNQKRWSVIYSFHNTGSFCYMYVSGNYPNTFWQKDMGEDEFWQAYRKERYEDA